MSRGSQADPDMGEFLFKEEFYRVVGLCMAVHEEPGTGHDFGTDEEMAGICGIRVFRISSYLYALTHHSGI
jgi:hypothetical protein